MLIIEHILIIGDKTEADDEKDDTPEDGGSNFTLFQKCHDMSAFKKMSATCHAK